MHHKKYIFRAPLKTLLSGNPDGASRSSNPHVHLSTLRFSDQDPPHHYSPESGFLEVPFHLKGFSLVEISISLAIIALLAAAVMTGGAIKHKVNLNQIVEDIDIISDAVTNFQTTYGALPGDIWNAESTFGATSVGDLIDEAPSDGDGNGNGNSVLESNLTSPTRNETLLFWQHLAVASLIEGSYNNLASQEPGVGVMAGPLKKSGYYASGIAPTATRITFSLYDTTATTGGYAALTPKEAYDIDTKYDDGKPESGHIQADEGTGQTAGSCSSGVNYSLSTTSKRCILIFTLIE